jgi:hypothetical protein
MAFQLVFQLERIARLAIELYAAIPRNGQSLSIGGERMIRNWMVKQVMNLWSSHYSYSRV